MCELARRNELLPIDRPERMRIRNADRLGLSIDSEIDVVVGDMLAGTSYEITDDWRTIADLNFAYHCVRISAFDVNDVKNPLLRVASNRFTPRLLLDVRTQIASFNRIGAISLLSNDSRIGRLCLDVIREYRIAFSFRYVLFDNFRCNARNNPLLDRSFRVSDQPRHCEE